MNTAACGGSDDEKSVLPGVKSLLFVKRAFEDEAGVQQVTGGDNQVIDYQRFVPGGGLYVLTPPTPSGKLRNLTESFESVDINGSDVSFDASQAVFSMRRKGDDYYHLYLANLDGSAEVRQLTFGDYDDIKPIYVPGDRIIFVTNQAYTEMGRRADEYNHGRRVTQIASISIPLGDADRRLCSHNLSHTADPFLLSDGTVAFSRWEHLGPVNDVKLFRMNPDCTQMIGFAGQHGKPSNSLVQVQELEKGLLIGVATSRERTIQAGALVKIDVRAASGSGAIAYDEQSAQTQTLTPDVPTGEQSPANGAGRYRTPRAMPETSQLLVSWSAGDVNERNELAGTAPNFGIYLFDPDSGRRVLVYDDPNMWDLYAVAVRPREAPATLAGTVAQAPDPNQPAVIGSIDITQTSLTDEQIQGGQFGKGLALPEALKQARKVRIIEGFSSEIGPVSQFGLTMHEGAAILGEVPIQSDGSWEARVPPYLPYHLQPIDAFGMSIRNQLLWIAAMPGEQRRCGGCHESRTRSVAPMMGTTIAQNLPEAKRNYLKTIEQRVELPWSNSTSAVKIEGTDYKNVQDLFDKKCVSCHSGGAGDTVAQMHPGYTVTVTREDGSQQAYAIPYLNLGGQALEVEYEMETVKYPASYVTLLYPSAMMGDSAITQGTRPPLWVTPGAARESRLIEKLNVPEMDKDPTAAATRWAWDKATHKPHPEDRGVALTNAERLLLIRMIDLGGQYWSRRNVQGGFVRYIPEYN